METIVKFFAALLALLTSCTASAQGWTQVADLPSTPFTSFEVIDGKIFTTTGNMLYTSSDGGETWNASEFTLQGGTFIYYFKKFGNRIFAASNKGIFSAPANDVEELWNHDINTLEISSFAERENRLYASVEGFGVMQYNGNAWMGYSSGLPNYSYNVSKLVNTPGELLAMAGGNGTFYRFNFWQGQWVEDYYINDALSPGLIIQDAMLLGDDLYASRYNMILRSDDFGANWTTDHEGLPSGQGRFMYAGQENLYVLTTDGASTTKINKRPLGAPAGTSWTNDSEVLPWFSWAIGEAGEKIFIAANDGVYVFDNTMGLENPAGKNTITVYPNPSADGSFTLQSENPVDEVAVYDLSGRLVYHETNPGSTTLFTIANSGIFVLKATTGNAAQTYKITVK